MKKNLFLQIAVVIAVLAMITINVLANALPLNGQHTGEISDRFAIFFVPAGYVFSIWGLIYLGLIGYAVYQALPAQRDQVRQAAIRPWVLAGSAANIAWIFAWHWNVFLLTLVFMAMLLVSLIMTYLQLGTGKIQAGKAETWLARVPFSIYLGWITVATIANVTQVLYFVGWGGWGIAPEAWAAIMLAVAVIVAGLMAFTRRDAGYLMVLVWAFIGIALKFPLVPMVMASAWVAAGLVAALAVFSLLPRRRAMILNAVVA